MSGRGVEHYKRYKEYFDLVEKLNMNAFRFGIEWSRIEPEEGKWDQAAIDHYKKYIAELRSRQCSARPGLGCTPDTARGGRRRSLSTQLQPQLPAR